MNKIKRCVCGGFAKLRKFGVSYAVVCSTCGDTGRRVYLDEDHTLCEIQNIAITAWNSKESKND